MHDKNNNQLAKSFWLKLRYVLVLSVLWCLFMVLLYNNASSSNTEHMENQMLTQAQTLYSFVLDTRNWNAKHGGVYVRESDFGKPNEWIPADNRTINMPDGSRFVLVNPAYMSRQISESSRLQGAHFKIISVKPLRPENMADSWDVLAFEKNALGEAEVYSYLSDDNGLRFRYLKPLYALDSCLYCHKGIKEGEVLGGISVSLDARAMFHNLNEQNDNLFLAYGFMALVGTTCFGGIGFLRHRKEQLREAQEKMKDAFVANMSHDMRTPLTGIIGMTQLLVQDAKLDEHKKAVSYLHLASTSLLEMVSDITDYAALSSGKVHLNMTNFDLRYELECCCALFLPQCKLKGLNLELFVQEGTPPYLVGDALRIRQVLGNIINNAVKFTESGKISIHVLYKDDVLFIDVMDTGSGIAKADQENIFTRFERGQAASQSDKPGTGLGLAIASEMLQLMHGRIELKSTLGEGSCFSLIIPVSIGQKPSDSMTQEVPVQGEAIEKEDIEKNENLCAGLQVLLAEDSAVTAYFVQTVLEKIGCQVYVVTSGEEALELVTKVKPDVILLDMRMPGIDGLTTANNIRAHTDHAKTPIILMSASILDMDRQILQSLNIEHILLKPVTASEIVNLVLSVTNIHALPLFERALALDALDNDEQLLTKLIHVWLDDYEAQHTRLLAGIEQGESICALAHAMKNSAATLYLTRLRHEATQVESKACLDYTKLVEAHVATYNYLKRRIKFNA